MPIAGGVASTTLTVKLAVAVLPALSVAVQVTVVVPMGKVLPEAGAQAEVSAPLIKSVAEAVNVTAAPFGPVASAVILPGTVMVGGVVSRTMTVKLPLAVFPALSFAVQPTIVMPRGKVLPEAGVQVGVTAPSTSSVAETV